MKSHDTSLLHLALLTQHNVFKFLVLWHVSALHSSSWLSGLPPCGWTTFCLSVDPEDGQLGGFHLSALVNGVLL